MKRLLLLGLMISSLSFASDAFKTAAEMCSSFAQLSGTAARDEYNNRGVQINREIMEYHIQRGSTICLNSSGISISPHTTSDFNPNLGTPLSHEYLSQMTDILANQVATGQFSITNFILDNAKAYAVGEAKKLCIGAAMTVGTASYTYVKAALAGNNTETEENDLKKAAREFKLKLEDEKRINGANELMSFELRALAESEHRINPSATFWQNKYLSALVKEGLLDLSGYEGNPLHLLRLDNPKANENN